MQISKLAIYFFEIALFFHASPSFSDEINWNKWSEQMLDRKLFPQNATFRRQVIDKVKVESEEVERTRRMVVIAWRVAHEAIRRDEEEGEKLRPEEIVKQLNVGKVVSNPVAAVRYWLALEEEKDEPVKPQVPFDLKWAQATKPKVEEAITAWLVEISTYRHHLKALARTVLKGKTISLDDFPGMQSLEKIAEQFDLDVPQFLALARELPDIFSEWSALSQLNPKIFAKMIKDSPPHETAQKSLEREPTEGTRNGHANPYTGKTTAERRLEVCAKESLFILSVFMEVVAYENVLMDLTGDREKFLEKADPVAVSKLDKRPTSTDMKELAKNINLSNTTMVKLLKRLPLFHARRNSIADFDRQVVYEINKEKLRQDVKDRILGDIVGLEPIMSRHLATGLYRLNNLKENRPDFPGSSGYGRWRIYNEVLSSDEELEYRRKRASLFYKSWSERAQIAERGEQFINFVRSSILSSKPLPKLYRMAAAFALRRTTAMRLLVDNLTSEEKDYLATQGLSINDKGDEFPCEEVLGDE